MTRRRTRLCGCAALALLSGCAGRIDPKRVADGVRSTLQRQAEAWNLGDIDGFMDSYEKTDRLTFNSGGRTERGWRATYDRYKKKYPTPARMGRLEFGELEIRPLDSDGAAALALGRWYLHREPDPVGGNFSLVLLRDKREWRIIHDHTSVDPNATPPATP